jgi:hypothetical protein
MADKSYAFLKFGKEEHLHKLRQGSLYLNTLRYFHDLEFDLERGDPFEGVDTIIQPKHIADFTLDTNTSLGKITAAPQDCSGPILIGKNRTLACNVYCMFAITGPVDGEFVDERSLGLGDSFVLILNPSEFIKRVSRAATNAGYGYQSGLVQYFNSEEYSGDVGPFRKRTRFEHQKEFRFVVYPAGTRAIELMVGSLLDITSEILPACEVNTCLDFSTKSFHEAGLCDGTRV